MAYKSLADLIKIPEQEPMMSEMAPADYEKMQSEVSPDMVFSEPKLADITPSKPEKSQAPIIAEAGPQEPSTPPPSEPPMSKSEALIAEYNKLLGKGESDLAEARKRDRMLKIGGSIGDALATYLNAQSQMNVKAPGVQIQQGAGLGKVADMFATSPEIASDLAQRREALMNQYKQMSMAEMSKAKRESAEKIAEDRNKLMEEKNRLYGQQVAKMGSGKEDAKQFRENKFEYDKIVKLQDSFNKDKQVVKAEERIQSAATLKDMVDGNPITQEAAKTFAARASGEVGALSDQDRAAYGGSKAIIDRINSTFTRAVTGELTDTDKKFMKELADKFEQAGQRDLQSRLSVYSKQGTKRTKMSEDEVKETIRPDLAIPQQEQQTISNIQQKVKIRAPSGDVREVSQQNAEEYLKRPGYSKVR
jgi:hypothetical protein